MITPDLDLKVVTRCTKFSIQDKTGIDTGAGTKWAGVSGLDPATLTSAVIQIINPLGIANDEVDVLSQIVANVTGTFRDFWFNDMTGTSEDGLHNILYKLRTTSFAITAFSDYGTTVLGTVRATASGHGLTTGMYVKIIGSTNYVGEHYVTYIDSSHFYFTDTWVTNDGACTGTRMYQSITYPYVYCRKEAKVDKMYASISVMASGPERTKRENDANTAWALLQSLKSAVSSSNVASLDTIADEIDQIIDFYDIDPNL
jgi:hypothetical protein